MRRLSALVLNRTGPLPPPPVGSRAPIRGGAAAARLLVSLRRMSQVGVFRRGELAFQSVQ
jgi:hypothetical protein